MQRFLASFVAVMSSRLDCFLFYILSSGSFLLALLMASAVLESDPELPASNESSAPNLVPRDTGNSIAPPAQPKRSW
jgi:hypothetical protein